MIKPHKIRKTPPSTGLAQYKGGKDNFKNIKEAYDYANRNGLNDALIAVGDGNIPMNQREYQVTLPNITITDGGIYNDVQEKRLNDLISHSEIHPITGKPQVIGAKSVYPEFDIITLGQQIPWKNIGNSLKSELQFLNSNLYSDNPVINAYATLARRYNLPDKARLPYLIRRVKSNQLDTDNSGNVILNGRRFSHTNFTYDRPVVSHSKGSWDNTQQTLLINPRNIVKNNKFGSIEPSDMFTIKDPERGLVVSPRDVINITANPTSIRLSKKYGIRTISSDELRNQELKALKKDHDAYVQNFGKRFKLARGSRTEINRDYWNAVHDLQKLYGKPKIKDVRLLEKLTGQKSGISDLSDLQNFKNVSRDRILNTPISEIDQVIDNLPKFGNGRRFNWTNYNDQNGITFPYTNFFYDPATPAESLFKFKSGKDNSIIQNTSAYNQWRSTLPKNLQTETPDYDLYEAFKAGLQPEWNDEDKSYHLGSRDPKTGRMLKKPGHPTFGQAIYNDMLLGYYPIYKDGEIYTENPFKYNKGKDSGIHIKKANRGKFTKAAEQHGMSVQQFANKVLKAPKGKYSSTLRKRANFARNAKKFNH